LVALPQRSLLERDPRPRRMRSRALKIGITTLRWRSWIIG
jgi:hypothetical protein